MGGRSTVCSVAQPDHSQVRCAGTCAGGSKQMPQRPQGLTLGTVAGSNAKPVHHAHANSHCPSCAVQAGKASRHLQRGHHTDHRRRRRAGNDAARGAELSPGRGSQGGDRGEGSSCCRSRGPASRLRSSGRKPTIPVRRTVRSRAHAGAPASQQVASACGERCGEARPCRCDANASTRGLHICSSKPCG